MTQLKMLFSNWFLYYLRIENKVCVNSIGYELPRHPSSLGGLRLARHFTWQTRPARHGREPRKVLLRWSAFLFSVRPSNTSTCICPPLSATAHSPEALRRFEKLSSLIRCPQRGTLWIARKSPALCPNPLWQSASYKFIIRTSPVSIV